MIYADGGIASFAYGGLTKTNGGDHLLKVLTHKVLKHYSEEGIVNHGRN
jgi:hypothetical protein